MRVMSVYWHTFPGPSKSRRPSSGILRIRSENDCILYHGNINNCLDVTSCFSITHFATSSTEELVDHCLSFLQRKVVSLPPQLHRNINRLSKKSNQSNCSIEGSSSLKVKEVGMRQDSCQFQSPDEYLTPNGPSETAQSPTVEGRGHTGQLPGENVWWHEREAAQYGGKKVAQQSYLEPTFDFFFFKEYNQLLKR